MDHRNRESPNEYHQYHRSTARPIELRRATEADTERLFRWANDPETRRNSISPDSIPWEEHVAWLTKRLSDPDTLLLIAQVCGEPIGVVRFDLQPDHAVISLTVAPEQRGKGYARAMIEAACRLVDRPVIAHILPHNERSIAAFTRAGFRIMADAASGLVTMLYSAK